MRLQAHILDIREHPLEHWGDFLTVDTQLQPFLLSFVPRGQMRPVISTQAHFFGTRLAPRGHTGSLDPVHKARRGEIVVPAGQLGVTFIMHSQFLSR